MGDRGIGQSGIDRPWIEAEGRDKDVTRHMRPIHFPHSCIHLSADPLSSQYSVQASGR